MPKSLKEWEALEEGKPATTKVSNEELLKFLSKDLHTTKEVAAFLSVENGTAFSRLKRLEKNRIVVRKWEGNKSWWVAGKAVGEEPIPEGEEEE